MIGEIHLEHSVYHLLSGTDKYIFINGPANWRKYIRINRAFGSHKNHELIIDDEHGEEIGKIEKVKISHWYDGILEIDSEMGLYVLMYFEFDRVYIYGFFEEKSPEFKKLFMDKVTDGAIYINPGFISIHNFPK
jgi:hypothetical protein